MIAMTARRFLAPLPLLAFAAAAHAHPGHGAEGLHLLVHALADVDPRIAAFTVAGVVALLLNWRRRSALRDLVRRRTNGDC